MRKPHHSSVLTGIICDTEGCQKRIKANLAERKTSGRPLICYPCYRKANGMGPEKKKQKTEEN